MSFEFPNAGYPGGAFAEFHDVLAQELSGMGWDCELQPGSPFDDPAADPESYRLTRVQ